MAELFSVDRLKERQPFPDQVKGIPIGSKLKQGFIPSEKPADLAYMLVAEYCHVTGDYTPAPTEAVDAETGQVKSEGAVLLIDLAQEPPKVVRPMGSFALEKGLPVYEPIAQF